ncbi:hypothetical protein Bca4012_087455 [Brassica carinata]
MNSFFWSRRHLIYGGGRPLCLREGEVPSLYFASLRFREAVAFSAPLSSALSSGSVEEMSRFVVGLAACSLEKRSRLSDDALLRR